MTINIKSKGPTQSGHLTVSGKDLENQVAAKLKEVFEKSFRVEEVINKTKSKSELYKVTNEKKELLGYFGTQGRLFDILNSSDFWQLINASQPSRTVKSVWSKDLKPDVFILDVKNKNVEILELKFQKSQGSVDEKLQTAPYKQKMWNDLFVQFEFKINYQYILETKEFWTQENAKKKLKKYRDTFKWLDDNQIKYYFYEDMNELKWEDFIF